MIILYYLNIGRSLKFASVNHDSVISVLFAQLGNSPLSLAGLLRLVHQALSQLAWTHFRPCRRRWWARSVSLAGQALDFGAAEAARRPLGPQGCRSSRPRLGHSSGHFKRWEQEAGSLGLHISGKLVGVEADHQRHFAEVFTRLVQGKTLCSRKGPRSC